MAEVEHALQMKNVAFKIQSLLAQRRRGGIHMPHGNVTASRSILSSGLPPSRSSSGRRLDVASIEDDAGISVSQSGSTGDSEGLPPVASAGTQNFVDLSGSGDDMVIDAPSPLPPEPTTAPPDLGSVSLGGPTPTIVIERPSPLADDIAVTHGDKYAFSVASDAVKDQLLAPPPLKRGGGRPRKTQIFQVVALPDEGVAQNSAEEQVLSASPLKRGRGRPRNTETVASVDDEGVVASVVEEQLMPVLPPKRDRGRPRKIEILAAGSDDGDDDDDDIPDVTENAAADTVEEQHFPSIPAPVKRGRGRPRKTDTLVTRHDDLDDVAPDAAEDQTLSPQPFKRGRGRPRKSEIPATAHDDSIPPDVAQQPLHLPSSEPVKRGRGRPEKTDTPVSAVQDDNMAPNAAEGQPPKRGRGRPRKSETLTAVHDDSAASDTAVEQLLLPSPVPAKRGRGRPRKVVLPQPTIAAPQNRSLQQVEPSVSSLHYDGSSMSDGFATAHDIPVDAQFDQEAASAPPHAHFAPSFGGESSQSVQIASQVAVFETLEEDSGARRRSMRIREALTSDSGTKMQKLHASLTHLRPKRRKLKHQTDHDLHIDYATQNHAIHDLLDESHIFAKTWMSLLNIPSSTSLDRVSGPPVIPPLSPATPSAADMPSRGFEASPGIPVSEDSIQDANLRASAPSSPAVILSNQNVSFMTWGGQTQPRIGSPSSSSRLSAVDGPSIDDVPLPFNDPEYNMWINAMSGPSLAFNSQQEIAANHDMYAMQGVQWSNDVPTFIPANSSYASSSSVS